MNLLGDDRLLRDLRVAFLLKPTAAGLAQRQDREAFVKMGTWKARHTGVEVLSFFKCALGMLVLSQESKW